MKIKAFLFLLIFCSINVPVFSQWDTSISTDEMTGESKSYAHSPSVNATESMGSPYSNTRAWLGVGCDGGSEWSYIGFNMSPNLLNTSTMDSYDLIRTRIRWDDQMENVSLTQDWGAKFIHFSEDESAIRNIAASNTVLLELDWYGEGSTYFRFPLKGSSAAISKIRSECAN